MTLFEDQGRVLKDCTERFESLGIAYMLTGAMAMIEYAMMRRTKDIDFVTELFPDNADRIIEEFEFDYYVPRRGLRDAISRRTMFNLLHRETLVKVDCAMRKNTRFQEQAFSHRHRINFSGFDIWIISKEDLILSKLDWAKNTRSDKQMRDAASIMRNGYDEKYVEDWAKKLDIEDWLKDAVEMSGVRLKGTSREAEGIQNYLWMKRTTQHRAEYMFGLFAKARRKIIDSLPDDLPENEFKKQLYFQTYGEHLPEDFFKE